VPDIGGQDRVVLVVVEHEDFRELALRAHRMDFELAEPPADGDVLGGGQVLVAQDQHLVLDQGRLERPRDGGAHLRPEIEAVNLRPEPGTQPLHLERRACERLLALIGTGLDATDVDVHVQTRLLEAFPGEP
jgi:hypothetical protein